MSIAVVTDSTASLPPALRREHGIRAVPLHLVVDGVDRVEGDEADATSVIEALRRKASVSTARPAPKSFLDAYEAAAADGATEIISMHISGALSGTSDSARAAAEDAPVPVHVVDSRTVAMDLGFAAIGAARDAAAGRDVADVVERAKRRCAASSVRLVVTSLEQLRRGGRIGGASALLGSALSIKPVLHVVDGEVQPLERVRTTNKAIARLRALVQQDCENLPDWADGVEIAVHHVDAAERAQPLAESLIEQVDAPVDLYPISAIIGAHVGIGTVGVAVSPRPRD